MNNAAGALTGPMDSSNQRYPIVWENGRCADDTHNVARSITFMMILNTLSFGEFVLYYL